MNTPRTREIVRASAPRKKTRKLWPDGEYAQALTAADYLIALGQVTTNWSWLEEAMIHALTVLLGVEPGKSPARQIFRSVIATEARIAIMRSLLEESPLNENLPSTFDEIIDEFAALARIRNKYIHGLWTTETATKNVYLSEPSTSAMAEFFGNPRQVPLDKIKSVARRMNDLRLNILFAHFRASSQETLDTPNAPIGPA